VLEIIRVPRLHYFPIIVNAVVYDETRRAMYDYSALTTLESVPAAAAGAAVITPGRELANG